MLHYIWNTASIDRVKLRWHIFIISFIFIFFIDFIANLFLWYIFVYSILCGPVDDTILIIQRNENLIYNFISQMHMFSRLILGECLTDTGTLTVFIVSTIDPCGLVQGSTHCHLAPSNFMYQHWLLMFKNPRIEHQ